MAFKQVQDDNRVQPPISSPNEPPAKRKKPYKLLLFAFVAILVVGAVTFGYQKYGKKQPPQNQYFPSYITHDQFSIAAYYPKDLPSGYKVDNFKILKKNVLYYTVTDPKGQKFNVNIQQLITSFDFIAFKKKFVKPDEYNTPIGSNLVGIAGNDLIGSVQTADNVWIILNSKSTNAIKEMETITRSLRRVNL